MKTHHLWILWGVLLLSVHVGCHQPKAGLTVAGSTSVEPFAELLAEEYMSHRPESHIYVQGGGSTAGIQAVRSHTADIGMSSRPLVDDEKDLYAVPIARDAIAIIVHPNNPVGNLSLTEVQGVFSGDIRNWKELGGPTRPIILVTREEGSGTREAFQKFVMRKEQISLDALVQDSNGAVRQVVATISDAIGFISLGLVNEDVKALKISGVKPTLAKIDEGAYSLVRPFLFVFNQKPKGDAESFLNFVLSPKAQELLKKEGLVPLSRKLAGQ